MLKYSTYRSIYENVPVVTEQSSKNWGIYLKSKIASIPLNKLLFTLLIVAIFWTGAYSVFAGGTEKPTGEKQVIVQYGDSLWRIASLHKPADMDTRVYLDSIRRMNGLKGPDIQAGEVLSLPVW
ncbi:LysM peptidoglycan-binding domain-containing protein [Paenibacillus sp. FSL H8-0457]|uniref:LysM peptidoglycan-binding domain-containing protein n=1 Tax=Bacillales TaxID=1385 RepID=UPI0001787ED5|nr:MULTISPECIES: LysM peptidoglycan-binding domain-containing protein [Paenibacillus]ACX64644.1 Peptidoglycan-binding lysin domain protein [Paenibacillus sp. Y412MC10]ETT58156.1 peptidoglycan-binding lysin domain-containing protein [Paenibacillus sp. FSL H8-457]MCM3257149.1 LysM peptidoglycan-binding domain-containing protein [Paenibacillus lautus]